MKHEIESLLVSECQRQNVAIESPAVAALHARALGRAAGSSGGVRALEAFDELVGDLAIGFCVFKGPALSHTVYAREEARPFNDIDLLIGNTDAATVEELLIRLGRSSESARCLAKLDASGNPVHEIAGTAFGADFDLHFNPFGLVTPIRSESRLAEYMCRPPVEASWCGPAISIPSAELHLLIVLVNLCRRGGGALRFYADAARILAASDFRWTEFWALTRGEGLGAIATQSLVALREDLKLDIELPARAKRKWWGPTIAEPANAERIHRRAPLLSLRLQPHRAIDVQSLAHWYRPNQTQRLARFG